MAWKNRVKHSQVLVKRVKFSGQSLVAQKRKGEKKKKEK